MEPIREHSARLTWICIALLVISVLAKGFFAFFVISDLGQPTWDYRPVRDLPASSPYASYPPMPHPQHIRGAEGK